MLPAILRAQNAMVITTPADHKDLRAYQYGTPDQDIVMVFNESISEEIHETVRFEHMIPVYEYDAMSNVLFSLDSTGPDVRLDLMPGQSRFFVSDMDTAGMDIHSRPVTTQAAAITGPFTVTTASADTYPHFGQAFMLEALTDLSSYDWAAGFHGAIRYTTEFDFSGSGPAILSFDGGSESRQVWVNGCDAGCRISPEYCFDISDYVKDGKNTLVFETITTVFPQVCDDISMTSALRPMGITGNISIHW